MRYAMVAHLWANQAKPKATSGNMAFRGPVLYSFGTAIGCLHGDHVLLTSRGFGSSTGMHRGLAEDALSAEQKRHLIFVPIVQPKDATHHAHNIDSVLCRINKAKDQALRARTRGEMYRREAEGLIVQANRYIALFDLAVPPLTEDQDFQAVLEERLRVRAVEIALAEAARQALEDREQVAARWGLRLWAAGRRDRPPANAKDLMLRVKPDNPAMLETSRGAYVPLAQAILVARMAARARRKKATVVPAEPVQVGLFKLNQIDADGTIVVACHRIPWKETLRLAKLLAVDLSGPAAQRAG